MKRQHQKMTDGKSHPRAHRRVIWNKEDARGHTPWSEEYNKSRRVERVSINRILGTPNLRIFTKIPPSPIPSSDRGEYNLWRMLVLENMTLSTPLNKEHVVFLYYSNVFPSWIMIHSWTYMNKIFKTLI